MHDKVLFHLIPPFSTVVMKFNAVLPLYSSIRSYEVTVKILNGVALRGIQYKYIIKDFRTTLL